MDSLSAHPEHPIGRFEMLGDSRDAASDVRLIEAARRGDLEAFHLLVERYRSEVTAFLTRRTESRRDGEELFHEVVVRACRSFGTLKKASRFKSWLMRIAHNTSIDWIRRQVVMRRVKRLDEEPVDPAAAVAVEPDEGAERRLPGLIQEIAKLKTLYAVVLLLRGLEGMGHEDIAQLLKLKKSCVKTYLHRARVSLRNQMTPVPAAEAPAQEDGFRNSGKDDSRCA